MRKRIVCYCQLTSSSDSQMAKYLFNKNKAAEVERPKAPYVKVFNKLVKITSKADLDMYTKSGFNIVYK